MAITNPNLLDGVDTNGTNQGTPDTAIITDGYTFQSIPKSADMNRYFKELYRGMQFTKEVGVWQYDAAVSYSKQARIMRDQNIYRSLSDANQGNDPLTNPTFWQIDQWRMNTVTHDITVDNDYTLTSEQNNFGKVIITDTNPFLTTARNIIVSNEQKDFIVQNDTLQIITIKTNAGSGIAIAAGTKTWLLCDGVNVINAVEDMTSIFSIDSFLHIQDQRANGVDGGGSSVGVQTRVLNTVLTNSISGASLNANQIILPIGTYYCEAYSVGYVPLGYKALLENITTAVTFAAGSSEYNSVDSSTIKSLVSGLLTTTGVENIELQSYFNSARAVNGLGRAISSGDVEVYSDIKIWKVG